MHLRTPRSTSTHLGVAAVSGRVSSSCAHACSARAARVCIPAHTQAEQLTSGSAGLRSGHLSAWPRRHAPPSMHAAPPSAPTRACLHTDGKALLQGASILCVGPVRCRVPPHRSTSQQRVRRGQARMGPPRTSCGHACHVTLPLALHVPACANGRKPCGAHKGHAHGLLPMPAPHV